MTRDTKHYNPQMIIAVGFKVNNERAVQFRKWANSIVKDFLASQISSLTNPTNIANALTGMNNEKVNSTLVSNYVQHIIDSFRVVFSVVFVYGRFETGRENQTTVCIFERISKKHIIVE